MTVVQTMMTPGMMSRPVLTPWVPPSRRALRARSGAVAHLAKAKQVVAFSAFREDVLVLAVFPFSEETHQPYADDASEDGADVAQQDRSSEGHGLRCLRQHEGRHDEPHPEDGAQIDQGRDLPLLEVLEEPLVGAERHDGRVVREIGGHRAYRGCSGQAEERLHEGREKPVGQAHDAELGYQRGEGAGQDDHPHQEQNRVQNEVVSGSHGGLEGEGEPHLPGEHGEDAGDDDQGHDRLPRDRLDDLSLPRALVARLFSIDSKGHAFTPLLTLRDLLDGPLRGFSNDVAGGRHFQSLLEEGELAAVSASADGSQRFSLHLVGVVFGEAVTEEG